MNQEVIQDFLNLPGIVGFALMDGRSRPYFYGVDQSLNFQQKEVLAQGILQVVETIPEGFESFKFQFAEHQAYLYKVEQEMILLVLTCDDLVHADYLQTIKNLKASLREDIDNAIAQFRLIASPPVQANNTPQPQNTETIPSQTASSPLPPDAPNPDHSPQNATVAAFAPEPDALSAQADSPLSSISLHLALAALNQLSQFTTRYLGTQVIVNYWKATRPDHPWLENFQIDRAAQMTFASSPSMDLQKPLSLDQQLWLQEWVAAFIKRCSQIVRDFPDLIRQSALTSEQKTLLLG
jgi:hypothetical protein